MTDGFKELMSAQTTDHIIELIPEVIQNMSDEEWKKEKVFLCKLQEKLIRRKGDSGRKLDYQHDFATEDIKIIIYNNVYASKPNTVCDTCGKEIYKGAPQYRNYCSTECFSKYGKQYCAVYNNGILSYDIKI